jgi:hypothetical protein
MRAILTLLFIILISGVARAQATATFTASATIIQPIGITTLANLNFARIDARTGGEVILTPREERIATGNSVLEAGGNVTAAAFEVTGQPGFAFSLSLPSGAHALTNGREQMIIKDFTSSFKEGELTAGRSTFKVGATLIVDANQTPGDYSTSTPLQVTVNYN